MNENELLARMLTCLQDFWAETYVKELEPARLQSELDYPAGNWNGSGILVMELECRKRILVKPIEPKTFGSVFYLFHELHACEIKSMFDWVDSVLFFKNLR